MLLKDDTNLLEGLVHALHPRTLPVARRPLVLLPLPLILEPVEQILVFCFFCIFGPHPLVLEPVGPRLCLLVLLEAPGGDSLDQDVHRVFRSRSRRWRRIKHRVGDVNGWTSILDLRICY